MAGSVLRDAAQKLKVFCKKTECETCPFYIEEIDYCGIRVPEEWILDDAEKSEDEEWKALLD